MAPLKADYYVYMLLDPRKFYLPFYVGKGKDNRCKIHLTETLANTNNKRKVGYIRNMRIDGYEPSIMLWKDCLIESKAYELETKLINDFGRKGFDKDGILMNITKGGTGGPVMKGAKNPIYGTKRPQSVRDAISKANKGKTPWNRGIPRTEAVKDAIGKANKERVDPYKGKKRSDKARNNIREGVSKFRKANPNHKIKSRPITHTEETKKKISKANKGQIPWNKGIPMSEEAKKKSLETRRRKRNE